MPREGGNKCPESGDEGFGLRGRGMTRAGVGRGVVTASQWSGRVEWSQEGRGIECEGERRRERCRR